MGDKKIIRTWFNPGTSKYEEYNPDDLDSIFTSKQKKYLDEYKGARDIQKVFRGYSKRRDYPKRLQKKRASEKRKRQASAKKKKVLKNMFNERKNMLARQQSYDAKYNKPDFIEEDSFDKGLERGISYNEDKPQVPEYVLDAALDEFDKKERFPRKSYFTPKTKQELQLQDEDDDYLFAPYSSAKLNRGILPTGKPKNNWFGFGKYGGKKTRKKKKGGIHEIVIPTLLVGANNLSKKKRKSKKQKKNKTKSKK